MITADRLLVLIMSVAVLSAAFYQRIVDGSIPLLFVLVALLAFYHIIRFVADIAQMLNKRKSNW